MIDEQMGAAYGDYISCRDDQIPEAKKLLLEQLIDMIRAMATLDEFWIVTRLLNADRPDDITVGYKICIPHMSPTCFSLLYKESFAPTNRVCGGAMKKKQKKLYMPYCIVDYLQWEITGKALYCDECHFADRCEKYRAALQSKGE